MPKLSPDDLKNIPGIGKNMERHLADVGIHTIGDLAGQDAEELYQRDCLAQGCALDRCVLYVFRMAVYYANNEIRDPEKLKWWNWKDKV